uniref:hypothetical protein n=1 Tax=Shewanella sp. TaxID=50422 RepID=UPI0040473374
MARATGKEAIRLWFEFLKRAYHAEGVEVNTKLYQSWGDVPNTKFETWWKTNAEQLFPYRKVEVVQRYLNDAGVVHVSVPMALTPTEAANQVRQVLIDHYKGIDHEPKPQRVYELTNGAEIKVSALRAYLATYDANQRLMATLEVERVPAKLLLAEVRRVYMARSHKWKQTKRKVEGLPMALVGDIEYDSETDTVVARGSDVSAERAVRRYLAIANNLVSAAARGDFPSRDYFKL